MPWAGTCQGRQWPRLPSICALRATAVDCSSHGGVSRGAQMAASLRRPKGARVAPPALQFKQVVWAEHKLTLPTWKEPMARPEKHAFWELDWQRQEPIRTGQQQHWSRVLAVVVMEGKTQDSDHFTSPRGVSVPMRLAMGNRCLVPTRSECSNACLKHGNTSLKVQTKTSY